MLWLSAYSTTTSLFFADRRASLNSSIVWTFFTRSSLSTLRVAAPLADIDDFDVWDIEFLERKALLYFLVFLVMIVNGDE